MKKIWPILSLIVVGSVAAAVYWHYVNHEAYDDGVEVIDETGRDISAATLREKKPQPQVVLNLAEPTDDLVRIAEIRVEFPGGEAVDVSLINYEPRWPSYAVNRPLAEAIGQLEVAANNGDGAAARHLYRSLRRCKTAFRDSASLNDAINGLRDTGKITFPDGSTGGIAEGLSTHELEEIAHEKFEYCEGVPEAKITGLDSWARKSAEAGDFLGIRDYAMQIGFDTPESFALYADLWDQGHLSAVQALAILHGRGITDHGTGQPNLIESYAFILISNQVLATALSREGQRLSADPTQTSNRIQMMDQVLAQRGAYLTPGQQQDAEKLAVNLLRSNTSCCKGKW